MDFEIDEQMRPKGLPAGIDQGRSKMLSEYAIADLADLEDLLLHSCHLIPRYHYGRCLNQRRRIFTVAEKAGVRFLIGQPDMHVMNRIGDAGLLLEACFSHRVDRALLYAENLTPQFFDLSSGEAGSILQKLRSYHIRLAVVCTPGAVRFSSRFEELRAEENRRDYFRLFESEQPAREWLASL